MTREQRTLVQVFAALTMLVDHIGLIFFPEQILLVSRAYTAGGFGFSAGLLAGVRAGGRKSAVYAGMGRAGGLVLAAGNGGGADCRRVPAFCGVLGQNILRLVWRMDGVPVCCLPPAARCLFLRAGGDNGSVLF